MPPAPDASRDVSRFFQACTLGMVGTTSLLSLYGYLFVRSHALKLQQEMQLFAAHGMTTVIRPDDAYLTAARHQLGNALLFGCTLGVLFALMGSLLALRPWFRGRFRRGDLIWLVPYGAVCLCLCYSREMPALALSCAALTPGAFFLPFAGVMRRRRERVCPSLKRWGFCVLVLVLPVLTLSSSSFIQIRDGMLMLPGLREVSTFYYQHTLIAADVIKPLAQRSQNVIALAHSRARIGPRPHGTLWIRSVDPCRLAGSSSLVAGTQDLPCTALRGEDASPLNAQNRSITAGSRLFDRNRPMRRGIGTALKALPLVGLLALVWLGFALAGRGLTLTTLLLGIYLAGWLPAGYQVFLIHQLQTHPEKVHAYVLSEHEAQRYVTLLSAPDELSARELERYARDQSPRVRLNALIVAGQRGQGDLLPLLKEASNML